MKKKAEGDGKVLKKEEKTTEEKKNVFPRMLEYDRGGKETKARIGGNTFSWPEGVNWAQKTVKKLQGPRGGGRERFGIGFRGQNDGGGGREVKVGDWEETTKGFLQERSKKKKTRGRAKKKGRGHPDHVHKTEKGDPKASKRQTNYTSKNKQGTKQNRNLIQRSSNAAKTGRKYPLIRKKKMDQPIIKQSQKKKGRDLKNRRSRKERRPCLSGVERGQMGREKAGKKKTEMWAPS